MSATAPLPVVRTVAGLRAAVATARREGRTIGLTPTMGALHDGHLGLIGEARARAGFVVASVFVNPAQFAPSEDFASYPRNEARDAELLGAAGCDLLFAPDAAEIYPDGFATSVTVAGPAQGLETEFRPHFFGGVAVVVAKLLNQVQADVAVFGEKDYQQLLVIRRLALDLDIPTEIVGAPTARDDHGLALSSRNTYLSIEELSVARRLNGVLRGVGEEAGGGAPIAALERQGAAALRKAGFDRVDYVAVRRADDLAPFAGGIVDAPARVLGAAWLGRTRLIDNMAV